MGRLESVFIAMERKGSQKSCQVLKSVRFMEIIHFALSPQNFPDEFLKFFMVQLSVVTVFFVAFKTNNLHLYYSYDLNFLIIELSRFWSGNCTRRNM